MKERRIVMTGFMGAGKTTVALALTRAMGCGCIDLDEFITAREGRTTPQLIDEEGEAHFREAETRALREALVGEGARVIALGGGTWAFERNRALVAAHECLTVWLDASFELCWRRITTGGVQVERPFARDRKQARRLYDERLTAYRLADLCVRITPEMSAEDVACEIQHRIMQGIGDKVRATNSWSENDDE